MEDFSSNRSMDPRDPSNPDHVPAHVLAAGHVPARARESQPEESAGGDDSSEESNS